MCNLYTGRAAPQATPLNPDTVTNNTTTNDFNQPQHVDHTTCLHDFIALEDGAVACTICYWVWEVEEGLE